MIYEMLLLVENVLPTYIDIIYLYIYRYMYTHTTEYGAVW